MRKLIVRLRQLRDDHGAALPYIAFMLVTLLGLSAFAVDLGWLFLNGSRLQRAADASSLAGVVYLPGDTGNVVAKSIDGATANGYDIGMVNGVSVGGGPDDLTWVALEDNKLEVTLRTTVRSYFLKVLGFDTFDIAKKSTAEYIKPVPLGSPANCIGIGQAVTGVGLDGSALGSFTECNAYPQNFWAAINGRDTDLHHGDPYAVTCGYNCSGGNGNFSPNYYHAVDVPPGTGWVDIYLYDAGFYDRSAWAETGDEQSLSNSSSGGPHMRWQIFQPDGTPQIPTDNSVDASCSIGSDSLSINAGNNSGTFMNRWYRMCRLSAPTPGLYILRTSNAGATRGGTSHFSILAANDQPVTNPTRVYALNNMSIFTNAPSGQGTVYIAEVDKVHAGKILELTFFDPGEGSGNADMTVLAPPGTGGIGCSWTATDVTDSANATSGSSCTIATTISGNAQFNGEWITVRIDIPSGYDCDVEAGDDCFWKMDLDLNTSHDRTTWEARVIGNPVRLVPNN